MNLAGFFHITQRAIRQMVTQGSGHIVNISTSLVDHADSTRPAALAALTKGGLAAVARSLAIEYASRGVRCNAVVPRGHQDPDARPRVLRGHGRRPSAGSGRSATSSTAILYLERATFVTGETLHIDGGQAAGQ